MAKCKILGCNNEVCWHWQMTIDSDNPFVFSCIGCFYRGFTAINICDRHRDLIKQGKTVDFIYKGKQFRFENKKIKEVT